MTKKRKVIYNKMQEKLCSWRQLIFLNDRTIFDKFLTIETLNTSKTGTYYLLVYFRYVPKVGRFYPKVNFSRIVKFWPKKFFFDENAYESIFQNLLS